MSWVPVAKLSEIPPGGAKCVDVGQIPVALFNVEGKIHALMNQCPHRGGPVGEGERDGAVVTCPWHGWAFDVRTGECVNNPLVTARAFAARVEEGVVSVEL